MGNKIKLTFRLLKRHMHILKSVLCDEIIYLNYQMGKVASSTVSEFLRTKGKLEWHQHRFTDIPIYNYKKKDKYLKVIDKHLLNLILKKSPKIKIISGFRDPIARNISMFFHTYKTVFPERNILEEPLQSIISDFNNHFPKETAYFWFRDELKESLGINLLDFEFNKERGFVNIEINRIQIFVYRMDKLDQLEQEIINFLEIVDYKLINTNLAEKKQYTNRYKEFIHNYKISEFEFDRIFALESVIYFYTQNDINKLKRKWVL
jgi:hypothetical protein